MCKCGLRNVKNTIVDCVVKVGSEDGGEHEVVRGARVTVLLHMDGTDEHSV